MNTALPEITVRRSPADDLHLERLFEQARRYPLLSPDQERAIDERKWAAAAQARNALLRSPAGRALLVALAAELLERPPQIEQFALREHHFLLRREFSEGGRGRQRRDALAALAVPDASRDPAHWRELAESLHWQATLWTGLATCLLRRLGGCEACPVADALEAWARHWQAPLTTAHREDATRCQLQLALRDYTEARDSLTLHNLRLVYTIAGRNLGRGVPLADLVQEGCVGLMRAAEKFEAHRGFRFSTYCYNWISQAVNRAVGESGALIRYPAHVREQVNRLHGAREQLHWREGLAADDETLARATGIDLARTRRLRQLRNFTTSLDAPVSWDNDQTLAEQLPDPGEDCSRDAELSSLHRCLLREIDRLDDTERRVVLARWGLHEGPALSRGEVAEQLAVSREWVRQLEASALEKLRGNITLRALFEDHADGP